MPFGKTTGQFRRASFRSNGSIGSDPAFSRLPSRTFPRRVTPDRVISSARTDRSDVTSAQDSEQPVACNLASHRGRVSNFGGLPAARDPRASRTVSGVTVIG